MSRTVRSIFFLVFLLVVAPTPSHSFYTYYSRYRNTVSLAHSLMIGVANLRASRGDVAGADRARAIADKLERGLGLGFWRLAVAAGWDYVTSFAWWKDLSMMELYGAVSEMNELLRGLTELTQLGSDQARAAWVGRNYQNVLTISKSLCAKLLKAFRKSAVMREIVETVKKEVIEGGLVRDCLELGSKDLKALIQTLKDFAVRFFPHTDSDTHSKRYRSDL